MKLKSSTKQVRKTPESQSKAFIETARKAECDESEAAFEGKLRRIAKAMPKPAKKEKGRGR
jgi:hypothetical protein